MHNLSDYDYDLPEKLIAQEPLAQRDGSRLLHLDKLTGEVYHRMFTDVPTLLREGDVLVVNNTRVTALRLLGERPTGGAVECLLLRNHEVPRSFEALCKPAKKLQIGTLVHFPGGLTAEVTGIGGEGKRIIQFLEVQDLGEKLNSFGSAPLPPYIHHRLEDRERYQTTYAKHGGSSAAPTAGLHFTPEILSKLEEQGVRIAEVTLDVGIDTFRPVQNEDLSQHVMHGERCAISNEASEIINSAEGRVVCVGTTSVRTLETHAVAKGRVEPGECVSKLFITPGFEWQIVDGMFTNFHLPKTTMLMMISALADPKTVHNSYQIAISQHYRFLSFGDSMLII